VKEGGIFWTYGLVSFARFLGIYAELGWVRITSCPGRGFGRNFYLMFSLGLEFASAEK
jgi:hypothetical protein